MVKSMRGRALAQVILGLLLVVGLPLGAVSLYLLISLPDVVPLAKTNPTSTALMDARRVEALEQRRPVPRQWSWVPLSRISPHLQRAVVVAEDASFYSHHGFDWEGIQEAAMRNWAKGQLRRGGSTITQQLAKNLYLSSDKTLLRKAHEALIARLLEQHLSKKRILELYLNVVEWGNGVYGAEAAAQHHFGKSAMDVTPEEAALLAAMLPAPRYYDPLRATLYLTRRQQQILRWMEKRPPLQRGSPVSPTSAS
jgi:monofunctional biosynthetic peptidoglycan transglycosylase